MITKGSTNKKAQSDHKHTYLQSYKNCTDTKYRCKNITKRSRTIAKRLNNNYKDYTTTKNPTTTKTQNNEIHKDDQEMNHKHGDQTNDYTQKHRTYIETGNNFKETQILVCWLFQSGSCAAGVVVLCGGGGSFKSLIDFCKETLRKVQYAWISLKKNKNLCDTKIIIITRWLSLDDGTNAADYYPPPED